MSVINVHKVSVASAVAAAMMSVSGVAAAAAPGFYVETDLAMDSAGFSSGDFDGLIELLEADEDFTFDVQDSSLDKSSVGFTLAVGYQITPNIGVEAAYMDLGKVSFDASGTVDGGEGAVADFGVGVSYKSKGPSLSVIGTWPLNEMFSLDARAGAYRGKTSANVSASVDEESVELPAGSHTNTALLVGVGATWTVSENVGLHFGYTRLQDAVAEENVDRFAIGLRITF
jgi:opacity protein-like surface antigen